MNKDDIYVYTSGYTEKVIPELTVNEFLLIHSETNEKQTALGRYDGKNIVPLAFLKERPFGVCPRNAGQKFMQEALMTDADKAPLSLLKVLQERLKLFTH